MRQRKFDTQFKIDAANFLEASGKTQTAVVTEFVIVYDALSRWRKEFRESDLETFIWQGNPRDIELISY